MSESSWTTIRGGSGLGDSLYVQPIARHLVRGGHNVEICTWYPGVFIPLVKTGKARTVDFRRGKVDVYTHYVKRKEVEGTSQYEDGLISARMPMTVEYTLDWEVQSKHLINPLLQKANGRPIVAINMPRLPSGKVKEGDIYWEMEPKWHVYQDIVSRISERAFTVQIGAGECRYPLTNVNMSLANQTTVADLIDVATVCDGFFSTCSFVVPLAESLNKPALYLWSMRGLESRNKITRYTTPQKVLHKENQKYLTDSCTELQMDAAVDALLETG